MRFLEPVPPALLSECAEVLAELRTQFQPRELVERIRAQFSSGYRLVAGASEGVIVAVAGFRFGHNLAWGKFLYVDDLVTRSAGRSGGHGAAMLGWLEELARSEGCDQLHLDSGTVRTGAHRFYLRQRYDITSFHFRKVLGE